MMKTVLLAGAALAALSAAPAAAQDVDASLTFTNNIDTSIVTDLNFESDVTMTGDIDVDGELDVDAAAVAVSDTKQVLDGQAVIYDEADENTDGDGEDDSTNANFSAGGDVDSDGNVGANTAAGYYNQQSNIATIAVATGGEDDTDTEAGGMAQANTTAAQSLTGTLVSDDGTGDDLVDSMEQTNGATSGAVGGSGNIGSNSAAGAFNQQQNIMTLAVASDSSLAEASAGVVQWSAGNGAVVQDATNFADGGAITGAGNISVNTAAGVGNQQHNSLTVAASGAFGGNGTGGADAGGL